MSTEGKIVEQGSYNDLAQDFFSQFNKFKQGKWTQQTNIQKF